MNRGIKAIIAALVAIVVATSAFIGGVLFQRATTSAGSLTQLIAPSTTDAGALVDQVRGIIRADALVPSSDDSMTTNAIDGMLRSLDDTHSAYYTPKEYAEFQQGQTGQFYGIGVTVSLDASGQPTLGQVFDNTPASRAGLKAGDVVTSVNGVTRKWTDIQQFVDLVRGPKGTSVTLAIKRGAAAPFTVTIVRDKVVVPNTETKTFGTVGYVRLFSFNDNAAADVQKAIAAFDAKGIKGYVLDLRENPGGLVDQAVALTSLFVDSGVVVRIDERGKPEVAIDAQGTKMTGKPLVLLVDANSASASEIVTGALKDYGRATIVGTRTYGKGSVQTVLPLDNGGALKLTTAHYLTPLKRVIDKIGVTPDYMVPMDLKLQLDPGKDVQLQKALSVLRSKL
jgi:carboxyl-terminal processing protease